MMPQDLDNFSTSLAAAKDYVDTIIKQPLEQLGGILSDTVGFWRLKNKVRLLLKAKKYIESKGIKPEKLIPSVFVPLMEEAGNTDDETLSEMFARLLSSHLDPDAANEVHPAFAKVLGQLSPLDALVLKTIDDRHRDRVETFDQRVKMPEGRIYYPLTPIDIIERIKKSSPELADPEAIGLSLQNLKRLGICQDEYELVKIGVMKDSKLGWRTSDFGKHLLSACSEPGTYWWDAEQEKFKAELLAARRRVAERKETNPQKSRTSSSSMTG